MTEAMLHLDPDQERVVGHGSGPLSLLGGPGTGKTAVLFERFVTLATSTRWTPDRVLMLVANRGQKIELQRRLARRLLSDEGIEALVEVPVYTWHGLAYHLVTRHYDKLAYPEPPVLLTSPEQWGDIRDALAGEQEVNWPSHGHLLRNPGFVDEVVDFCIRAEQRMLEERELSALAQARPGWDEIVRFFKAHRKRLRSRARVDYPTLLADAADLLANYDEVRSAMQERFVHLLVDDAQELSLVQRRLLAFLAGAYDSEGQGDRSLVVAADPDSSIETFRGADPGWLERFGEDFGPHDRVVLRRSYRLGNDIGDRATPFIAVTGEADWRPHEFAGTTALEVKAFPNLGAEVEDVARTLRHAHLHDGVAYEDMALLLASPRAMLPVLERALGAVEVPYSISVPDRPLEREPAVRSFVQLARFASGEERSSEELSALLRSQLIGIEDHDARALERAARLSGVELEPLLRALPDDTPAPVRERVETLFVLERMLKARSGRAADEVFWTVWENAPHYRDLERRARADISDPANRDLDALVAFSKALGRFVERRRGSGTLNDYLEAIGRADFGSDPWLSPERSGGGVQILSFHSAKGKEWSVVAVCGCVEGAIPKGRRARGLFDPYWLDEASAVDRALRNEAEDRRVFYVALTRARARCIVTTSPGPSRKGRPSRFLTDLVDGEIPMYAAAELPPLTLSEAAARHRRALADVTRPVPERLAALGAVAHICEVDPTCTAAQPTEWWWRWDWTEGDVPIRVQQGPPADELGYDKLRTSYSRISEYDNCGLKYLCQVVLGLDPDSSHAMAFGTWIHKIFEEVETGRITGLEQARARYEELFGESVFPNRVIARGYRRDGELILERYGTLKPGESELAEVDFKVDFHGHRLTGRIDRVDKIGKNIVISDYKTSRNPIHWEAARDSLQLAIYYAAAKSDERLSSLGEPISMQMVYPRAELSRGEVQKRCQKPEEAEVVLERLPDLIEGVLAEDFRPRVDADCQWCRFKPLCPLWPEGRELPA